MTIDILLALATAFTMSCSISGVLSRYRGRWVMLDVPNDRSLHAAPVPRSGGLAIISGLAAGVLVAAGNLETLPGPAWLFAALLLTFIVSLADGLWGLSPLKRLTFHFLAAALLVFGGG